MKGCYQPCMATQHTCVDHQHEVWLLVADHHHHEDIITLAWCSAGRNQDHTTALRPMRQHR
jgi:hypothetical protein